MFSIFRSKLQNRFILFFIALGTVPVLVLGGVSLYSIDLSHKRDVSNLELQLIDQKEQEIRKFFSDTLGIIELRVGFSETSEIDLLQQEFLLDGMLDENRAFEEVSFIRLNGREIIKKSRDGNERLLQDVSGFASFIAAAKGNNFIGEVHETSSGPILTIAAPVRNRNNDIIQVISAQVNLSFLVRLVETARLGSSGYLILLDTKGSIIAPQSAKRADMNARLSQSTRVRRILAGELLDGLDPADRYESLLTQLRVIGAGRRILPAKWILLSEWPISDADGVIQDVRGHVVKVTLLSIFLVLVLVPFFVARLLRPIHALQESAAEIEKGNFQKRVEISTHDELEDLGTAFNKMTAGLKRLAELRDEFVFIAAHELRSPVTVIKGYVYMLLKEETSAVTVKARGYLENIESANDRLAQLVNDLLEVARSEAGRISIEVGKIDMRESVGAAVEEIRPLASKKSITLQYNTLTDMPLVMADSNRIKEVIINLVSNAIKYSPQGAKVSVSHEVKGKELVTHVKDTGYGIAREAQAKLFEKFYRVRTNDTVNITGTGLGLFIIKELVTKMKGNIWFESEEKKGSTFSFSLPLA